MSKPDWLALLEKICRIDSRTEAAAAGTTQVAAELGHILSDLEFELSWVDPAPDEGVRGRHLRAVRNKGADRRLLMLAHVDTVLSPEEVPFRIDSGTQRVFGSGTCDMKGGCVLMLAALREAMESSAVRETQLTVLMNCSEEVASPSFTTMARAEAQDAMACLVFESARVGPNGEHHFPNHRKGAYRFLLKCRGRAAHSGSDHAHGVSAIREIARKIETLEALTDYTRDLTINVGRVEGGVVANQVPDQAAAWIDMRAYDQTLLDDTQAQIHQLCTESTVCSAADGATTSLELIDLPGFPAWPHCQESANLAQRYIELAKHRGIVAEAIGSGGGSDASFVADITPTLDGLGILGGKMHQPGEWADWESFPQRCSVAADMISELCETRPEIKRR